MTLGQSTQSINNWWCLLRHHCPIWKYLATPHQNYQNRVWRFINQLKSLKERLKVVKVIEYYYNNEVTKWDHNTHLSLPSFVHHCKCSMTYYILFCELIITHLDDFHFHKFPFYHRHVYSLYLFSLLMNRYLELDLALHSYYRELLITSKFKQSNCVSH